MQYITIHRQMVSFGWKILQNSMASKCPECGIYAARNLNRHLFFIHGYSGKNRRRGKKRKMLLVNDKFECYECCSVHASKRALASHKWSKHPLEGISKRSQLRCPLCDEQIEVGFPSPSNFFAERGIGERFGKTSTSFRRTVAYRAHTGRTCSNRWTV